MTELQRLQRREHDLANEIMIAKAKNMKLEVELEKAEEEREFWRDLAISLRQEKELRRDEY